MKTLTTVLSQLLPIGGCEQKLGFYLHVRTGTFGDMAEGGASAPREIESEEMPPEHGRDSGGLTTKFNCGGGFAENRSTNQNTPQPKKHSKTGDPAVNYNGLLGS